jgi:predicted PurR-regulated permease PerM
MATISDPTAALPERPMGAEVSEPAVTAVRKTQAERIAASAWDVDTKRSVVIILLIVAVVLIWTIRSFIPLLAIASVIAYFLNPVVDLAERVRLPRALSTLILYLLLLIGIILTPIIVVPILLAQLSSLNFDVPTTAFRLFAWVGETVNHMPPVWDVLGYQIPLSGLTTQIEENIRNLAFIPTLAEILGYFQQAISAATNVVSSTAAFGVSVVGSIFQIFVTFLLIFFLSLYMTKDSPDIRRYIEGLFPRSYQSEWIDLLRRMGYIWQSFFRGQLILCLVVGVTTWIALELAGMPGALLLGILAGTLEIIPTLGPTLSSIPAIIIALIQGSSVLAAYGVSNFGFALITIAIYFIIQQLENYILVPRIIGRGVNLHPIVVLIGVGIGVNLFGIMGALFAAPVLASLRVLGAYVHAKLLDYEPFQDQPLPPVHSRSRVYRRTVYGDDLPPRGRPPETTGTASVSKISSNGEMSANGEKGDNATTHYPAPPDHSSPPADSGVSTTDMAS